MKSPRSDNSDANIQKESTGSTNTETVMNDRLNELTSYNQNYDVNEKRECCPDCLRQTLCCLFVTVFICSSLTIGLYVHGILSLTEGKCII